MKMNAFVTMGLLGLSVFAVGCGAADDSGEFGSSDPGSFDGATEGEAVETQSEAAISCPQPWYRVGTYPPGQACYYACYYSSYPQCTCTVRNPTTVEMWVNNCPK